MMTDIIGGLVFAYGIARLMSSVLHTAKPMKLFWIDFGYRFMGILLAGLIIGVW